MGLLRTIKRLTVIIGQLDKQSDKLKMDNPDKPMAFRQNQGQQERSDNAPDRINRPTEPTNPTGLKQRSNNKQSKGPGQHENQE